MHTMFDMTAAFGCIINNLTTDLRQQPLEQTAAGQKGLQRLAAAAAAVIAGRGEAQEGQGTCQIQAFLVGAASSLLAYLLLIVRFFFSSSLLMDVDHKLSQFRMRTTSVHFAD